MLKRKKEIRAIALAYYHNFSKNEKHEAYAAFKRIDTNGGGKIPIDEYEEVFGIQDRLSFQEMDTNGDGKIDFEEFITLYYFVKFGMVLCDGDGCKVKFLKGVYFTCLECSRLNRTAIFDLCTSCYQYRNFVHEHDNFLDSHFLLRWKAAHAQDGVRLISFVYNDISTI